MPQLEKVLHGDLDAIRGKISHGVLSLSPLTSVRGSWETTVNGVRCVTVMYEKHDKKRFDGENWVPNPHYAMSVTLVDTGSEVRVGAITAGSAQDMYFIPDSGAEYGLFEALSITLDMWDHII